jgi:hypothetical protein
MEVYASGKEEGEGQEKSQEEEITHENIER